MTAAAAHLSWKSHGELVLARALKRWYGLRPRSLEAAAAPAFTLHGRGCAQRQSIPPIVWAYWEGGTPPLVVQRCVAGWRRLHPHFDIRVLDERSVLQYLPALPTALEGAPPPKRADWIRLALLLHHGGIWLDASTILTQPLDWVLAEQQRSGADFVGYYLDLYTSEPERPVVENWFLAAPPGSPFIAALHHEFTDEAVPRSGPEYIAHLRAQGIYEQVLQRIDAPAYLTMHLALQALLLRGDAYRLSLARAEDGPYLYHALGGWRRTPLKLRLLFSQIRGPLPPLIKLRAPDRRRLSDYLARGLYLPGSVAGQWLSCS